MKKIRKPALVFICLLALWILLGQGCMRFRISDKKSINFFKDKGLTLQLSKTNIYGCNLHYALIGDDNKPTLFFIHGSPGSWSAFKSYLDDEELLKYFRMVSIDRPGFGYSDYGNAMDLITQSRIIGSLIRQLQNGKNFYVIGHSLGGPLAVKLAAQSGKYISGVVLLAASVDPEEEKPEHWRRVLRLFPFLIPGAFRPSNIELWAFKKDVLTIPGDLNKITCPVIILQGLKDPLVPPGNAFYAQKKLIHADYVKLITFRDANHFIPWTRTAEIKEVLMGLPH